MSDVRSKETILDEFRTLMEGGSEVDQGLGIYSLLMEVACDLRDALRGSMQASLEMLQLYTEAFKLQSDPSPAFRPTHRRPELVYDVGTKVVLDTGETGEIAESPRDHYIVEVDGERREVTYRHMMAWRASEG